MHIIIHKYKIIASEYLRWLNKYIIGIILEWSELVIITFSQSNKKLYVSKKCWKTNILYVFLYARCRKYMNYMREIMNKNAYVS